ncbi:MAG: hypothetical protein Q8M95_10615 [Candidatus Methanoperedens sp.]|nr:hypothetical protein [Candidatus Methanoperedens sp.]
MATHLRIEIEYSIWEVAMTINPEQKTEFRSVWIKTVSVKLTISHPEDAEIIEKKRYTCTEAAQNDAFCNRSIRSG